jgi:transcriptional regulator with XRE-family HTH domain
MHKPLDSLADFVTGRRIFLGLSRRELARQVRVHHTSIWRIELKHQNPGILLAYRLARALQVDFEELAGRFISSESPSVRPSTRRKRRRLPPGSDRHQTPPGPSG